MYIIITSAYKLKIKEFQYACMLNILLFKNIVKSCYKITSMYFSN